MQLRAGARVMKNPALLKNDVANASGATRRIHVLQEMMRHDGLSLVVPLLLSIWEDKTPVAMRRASGPAPGAFCVFSVMDGLYQGECWSSLCFCISLRAALLCIRKRQPTLCALLLAYIDDLL